MPGIIVSPGYALSEAGQLEGWKPIIGQHSVITSSNVEADAAAAGYPASNLGNPSTANRFQSASTDEQFVTSLFAEADIEYIAAGRHNWGSGLVTASVEGLAFGGDPDDDGDWAEYAPAMIPADDGPILWRIASTPLIGVRLRLVPTATPPFLAVWKAGELIVLERGLPPGHQPINMARSVTKVSPRAIGGDYLGTVVTTARLSSSIVQQNLDPAWYRAELEPFRLAAGDENPFFWAWAPQDYPSEVGYCWVTNDPIPTISQTTGLIDITFQIDGVTV